MLGPESEASQSANPFRSAMSAEHNLSIATSASDSKTPPENELFNAPPSYDRDDLSTPVPTDVKVPLQSTPQWPSTGPLDPTPSSSHSSSYFAPTPTGYSTALVSNPDPRTPPPCFSRPPSEGLAYSSFKPIFLVAQGKTLDKGFPLVSPPSGDRPHPFVSHDINEVDWLGFLHAVKIAASLTEKDIRRSHLPLISIVPIINTLSAYGVQQFMKSRKGEVIVKTIELWNHHFFEPRKTRIILMKGQTKLSGNNERAIPDLHTPLSSNTSTVSEQISAEANAHKGKGKSIENHDEIVRLFLIPL